MLRNATATTQVSRYEKIRDMVNANVFADITDIAEACISFNDESDKYCNFSDFENSYWLECPECGTEFNGYHDVCPGCGFGTNGRAWIYNEVKPSEYYIVSQWIGEKLIEKGETVLRRPSRGYIWARRTSGQVIIADDVIENIAKESGILNITQ